MRKGMTEKIIKILLAFLVILGSVSIVAGITWGVASMEFGIKMLYATGAASAGVALIVLGTGGILSIIWDDRC